MRHSNKVWFHALATLAVLLWMPGAAAHESVTSEAVNAWLAKTEVLQAKLAANSTCESAASASVELGALLDDIGELFNKDIESHGKVQGLASTVLMGELAARGLPLAYSSRTHRYVTHLRYYQDALEWAPSGVSAAEAAYRLIKGYFYESFDADPLQPVDQTPARLAEQMRLAKTWRNRVSGADRQQEMLFILAIHTMQAAGVARAGRERAGLEQKAAVLVEEFLKKYPESLRAATLTALRERMSSR
ncbi:MAG: hypothetical protein ACKVP2_12280 [Burkholderiales bacterium]